MLGQILLAIAFVSAAIAALFTATVSRPPLAVNFGWLALALYLLSLLLAGR